jgi:hypothetical protein
MEEYHRTLSRRAKLSSIIRVMNATSPPGVHISPGDPVHDLLVYHNRKYRECFHRFLASMSIQFVCIGVEGRIAHTKVKTRLTMVEAIPFDLKEIQREKRSFSDCSNQFNSIRKIIQINILHSHEY